MTLQVLHRRVTTRGKTVIERMAYKIFFNGEWEMSGYLALHASISAFSVSVYTRNWITSIFVIDLRGPHIGNGVWSATNTHNTTPAASGFLYFLRPVSYFAAISILCVHGSNNNSVLPRTSLLRDASHWQSLTVRLLSDYITSFRLAQSRGLL